MSADIRAALERLIRMHELPRCEHEYYDAMTAARAALAAEPVGEHRVRWFFYSGFEKVGNHTQVYFAGTFSTDLADPRAYVDKAMELVAKDRNCSIDVLCLTALTPLEVSK
jgi:hypothetical protein